MEAFTGRPFLTKKCTNKNASVQFGNVSWAANLIGIFMFSAIFVPYIIATIRGTINPLIPFISQAAGSPPQSGVFAVFLSLSALVGFFGLHLLNLGISIYQARIPNEKRRFLQFFNRVSLIPGNIALLGMIIVGGYPVDFHRHNEDWILVTIGPHLIGALMLFVGGVVYCCTLTIIMIIIFPEKKKLLGVRIFLLAATILAALIHAGTVRPAFELEYSDEDRLKTCNLKLFEYDANYLVASASEWVMAITFVTFFMTLREEAKVMSVTVSVDLISSDSEDEICNVSSQATSVSNVSSAGSQCLFGKTNTAVEDDQDKSSRTKS